VCWALAIALLAFAFPAHASLELPLLFSDGAVLQRDRPLPVWGWAEPGARIEVTFDGRTAATVTKDNGAWRVELPAHAAGGPYRLEIVERGGDRVTVRDVLVGDVWLASGQSNMEWPVAEAQDAEREIAQARDAGIRHFKVPKSWSERPESRLAGGAWQSASPQTVGQFSAVAYYFARELRARNAGVPIGIINSTWSGSRIEAWMDAASLGVDAAATAAKMREVREADERALAAMRQRLARWPANPDDSAWMQADVDDDDWDTIPVPGLWETAGYKMDGVAWYRTRFELTAEEAAAGAVLGLGMIDDSDETWVNGHRVGATTNRWNLARVYRVGPEFLRAGINHLAVRVTDTGGGGGLHDIHEDPDQHRETDQPYLQPVGGARRALPSSWKFRPAVVTVATDDDKNQIGTLLFNRMIHPLQPYPLRGVIWYQGEANANDVDEARRYRAQFASLIQDWRADWSQPGLPFLWVQLASFDSGADRRAPDGRVLDSPWATLRESQSGTLALPATAQAVTIDIGDAHDIHPRNKSEVGRRLALAARHVAYGESLVHSGPIYHEAAFDRGRVRIEFDLQGSALATRGGGSEVHGFELAGEDGRFHPARATIEGDGVVVSSGAVAQPKAVRHAWRDNPEDADLVNREGLPTSPFRAEVR
jgi:sialate O-acetylesterase